MYQANLSLFPSFPENHKKRKGKKDGWGGGGGLWQNRITIDPSLVSKENKR